MKTIPNCEVKCKYDLIHIDGAHAEDIAKNDLVNCNKFAHENTLLVFDDSHTTHAKKLLEYSLTNKIINEVNYQEYNLKKSDFHRVFKYCSI